ncbi:MAG: hypothetical protein IJ277_05595, partial [Bacteroidaceae bacterium]|nr:hypothetical protein [Bacteroidaceae bacterium]
ELLFYEIRLRSLRVQASLLPLAGTNFAPFVGTKGEKEIDLMRECQIISTDNFIARQIIHGKQTCSHSPVRILLLLSKGENGIELM